MKGDALRPFTQKVQEIQQRMDALESRSKFIQNDASVLIQNVLVAIKLGTVLLIL